MQRRNVLIGAGAFALSGVGFSYVQLRDMGSMEAYNASVAETRAALTQTPSLVDLVRHATLAPNGHNTQPWRFSADSRRIVITPDLARRTPVVDPDDHHVFVSLGCAAENLAIAASAHGRSGTISHDVEHSGPLAFTFGDGPWAEPEMAEAITRRQSTRAAYDGRPVSAADLRTLVKAAETPGVDVVVLTDRPQMDRVRDLVVAGNSAQMADPAFLRELQSWIRFSPRRARESGDGMFSATTGNPALPEWLGPRLLDVMFKASSENDKYASHLRSSAGVAIFVSERADKDHWIRAGRASQRFALQATALGLKHAFVNQPVEVAALRPELSSLAGLPGRRPDLVMRFGYGRGTPYAARRPVATVLS